MWTRLQGAKFVYMAAHDMDVATVRNNFLARNWWWTFFRFAVAHSDLVIVQNELQRKSLSTFYSKSVVLIENGVPLDLIKTELSKDSSDGVIAVTRLVKFKRPELYLKLAKEIKPVKVTVLAHPTGDQELIEKYKKAEKKLDNLVWIKGVNWTETWKVIGGHKLLVNTSASEGFPNVFLQASALSVPIVALSVDPNGYLGRSGGGYACGGDWDRFVKTITLLYADTKKRRASGRLAKTYIGRYNSTQGLVRDKLAPALERL